MKKYLYFTIIIFLFGSCMSMNRIKKGLRQDTWTGRYASMFYKINKNKPNITQTRKLNKKDLDLLQIDLNFIVSQIRKNENILLRKFNELEVPNLEIKIKNDDFPNLTTDCDTKVVVINTGLIRKVFDKSFKTDFAREKLMDFSFYTKKKLNVNTDSSLFIFVNILYNLKLKKVNLFTSFFDDMDDDYSFEGMDMLTSIQQTISFADNELIKIVAFLISHEMYHLITNCEPPRSRDREIEADAYGILQYSRISNENVGVYEDYSGRRLPEIFYNLYSDYINYESDGVHLPIKERFMRIDSVLNIVRDQELESY